jgi:hypothetical protein
MDHRIYIVLKISFLKKKLFLSFITLKITLLISF